jgi:peptidoglycan/LPS O-acetylase OafA/YrhL
MRAGDSGGSHVAALDALRALAALAVVGLHLHALGGVFQNFPLLACLAPLGMFGVDLFYVLSGYFILGAVLRPVRWSAREFCIHRVRRIVPAYYASIILVLVGLYGAQAAGAGFFTPALAEDLLRHASFTHNLSAASHGSLNGVYWTLGVEMSFYAVMLLAAPALRARNALMWVIGGFVVCAWLWRAGVFMLAPHDPWVRYFWATQLPGALDTFAAGMVLAAVQHHRPEVLARMSGVSERVVLTAMVTVATAILFAYVLPLREQYWAVWGAAVFWRSGLAIAFGTGLLVFVLLPRQGLAERLLRISGLAYLGKISYSIYLFHVPLIFAALWAGQRVPVLGLRSVLFCVVVIALLLIASASYTLIEAPFLKNAGKLKPTRVFVLAGLVCALLAGAALRWQGLDRESLWSDELFSVGIAMHAGSPDAVPQHKALADLDIPDHFWSWKQADTAPPLYEILLAGWTRVLGGADAAVRALSVVFGLGLIALAGALPRGSPPLARIYFAFAAACNSALIEYSQEARAYALASFLVGLVTVLLLRDLARATRDEKSLQPSWLQLAAMSAAMMTHYYAIPYCGLLVTLYGLAAARAGHRLRLVVLSAPFVPVALYLIWGIDGILFKLGSPVSHDTTMLLSLLRAVKETGRMVIPGLGGWMWLVVLAFPWAAWRVWCSLSGGRPAPSVPEPVWLTVVVLPFIVVLGVATRGMEFFHPRYLLLALPGVLLLLSLVAGRLRPHLQGICAVIFGSVLILGIQHWLQRPLLSKDQYREAAVFITQHFAPGDRVVGMWRTNRMLYVHYLIPALGADYEAYLEGLVNAEQIDTSRAAQVPPGKKVFLFDHVALRGMTEAVRERLLARGFHDVARQDYFRMGVVVVQR